MPTILSHQRPFLVSSSLTTWRVRDRTDTVFEFRRDAAGKLSCVTYEWDDKALDWTEEDTNWPHETCLRVARGHGLRLPNGEAL